MNNKPKPKIGLKVAQNSKLQANKPQAKKPQIKRPQVNKTQDREVAAVKSGLHREIVIVDSMIFLR